MLDAERVGNRQRITAKLFDAVVTRCDGRRPMTANVVAQHPEVVAEIRCLRIPHRVILTERMRQHHHRTLIVAVQPVVVTNVVDGYKRHVS